MKKRVVGAGAFRKLLRRLPDEAAEGMADILNYAGARLLADMQATVPVRTGALRARLSKSRATPKTLRMRVGFRGKRANGPIRGGDLFYGRIVEFGRRSNQKRRSPGYAKGVGKLAPRPFVYKSRIELRSGIGNSLNRYWDNVLAAASAGVGGND